MKTRKTKAEKDKATGKIRNISYLISDACGYRYNGGCGMNMIFAVVENDCP